MLFALKIDTITLDETHYLMNLLLCWTQLSTASSTHACWQLLERAAQANQVWSWPVCFHACRRAACLAAKAGSTWSPSSRECIPAHPSRWRWRITCPLEP